MSNNVMRVEKDFAELYGFEKIKDIAYVIFRSQDLLIADHQTGYPREYTCKLQNRRIVDTTVVRKLRQYDFRDTHDFVGLKENTYACVYPAIEEERENLEITTE